MEPYHNIVGLDEIKKNDIPTSQREEVQISYVFKLEEAVQKKKIKLKKSQSKTNKQ